MYVHGFHCTAFPGECSDDNMNGTNNLDRVLRGYPPSFLHRRSLLQHHKRVSGMIDRDLTYMSTRTLSTVCMVYISQQGSCITEAPCCKTRHRQNKNTHHRAIRPSRYSVDYFRCFKTRPAYHSETDTLLLASNFTSSWGGCCPRWPLPV